MRSCPALPRTALLWPLEGIILQRLPPAGILILYLLAVVVSINDQCAATDTTAIHPGWRLVAQRLVRSFAVVEGEVLRQPHGQLWGTLTFSDTSD